MTSEMLYANGMVTIQMKAGISSERSSILISLMVVNINSPTITSTGLVATLGIERNNGAKNKETRKHNETTNDVTPDRPPTATPEALSTKVLTVLVPSIEPITVPMACILNCSMVQNYEIFCTCATISVAITCNNRQQHSLNRCNAQ